MNCLPDVNVWLALSFSAHPHHASALKWFDSKSSDTCGFCRMTQQGYLRLATKPKAFGRDALSLPQAWSAFDALMEDERVRFDREPADVEDAWREFTGKEEFSVKIWNDAYLAAFAKSSGHQLVTIDRGFRRYSGLSLKLLR